MNFSPLFFLFASLCFVESSLLPSFSVPYFIFFNAPSFVYLCHARMHIIFSHLPAHTQLLELCMQTVSLSVDIHTAWSPSLSFSLSRFGHNCIEKFLIFKLNALKTENVLVVCTEGLCSVRIQPTRKCSGATSPRSRKGKGKKVEFHKNENSEITNTRHSHCIKLNNVNFFNNKFPLSPEWTVRETLTIWYHQLIISLDGRTKELDKRCIIYIFAPGNHCVQSVLCENNRRRRSALQVEMHKNV